MNATIYCRFSPRRNPEEAETIKVQLEKCRAYCKAMGYEIVGEFSDEAKSGKDRKRDGLDDAMACAKKHQAVLVVRDLSRLSRDVRDSLDIRDELIKAGCGLADLETKIDTTGAAGKMLWTIILAVKNYQREDTAKRTSEAILWKQANGQRVSSSCPYGYRDGEEFKRGEKTFTKMVKDADEQKVIGRIVKMRADGMGIKAIADKLDEDEVPCRGSSWHSETVRRILKRVEAGK